jgi:hypothetical protein
MLLTVIHSPAQALFAGFLHPALFTPSCAMLAEFEEQVSRTLT